MGVRLACHWESQFMARHKLLLNAALALFVATIATGIGGYVYHEWTVRQAVSKLAADSPKPAPVQDGATPVRISQEARKNLELVSKSLQPTTYFRKIDVPGVLTDRPGISDRGVVAPVTGIVTQILAFPGNTVAPDAPLFSLRLVSESIHTSQLELFKATKEIEIARKQRQRLEGLTQTGGVAGSRLIEIDNQIQRMDVHVQAYRQDLKARGLPLDRIDAAAQGEFVTEIVVRAARNRTETTENPRSRRWHAYGSDAERAFERHNHTAPVTTVFFRRRTRPSRSNSVCVVWKCRQPHFGQQIPQAAWGCSGCFTLALSPRDREPATYR